MNFLALIVKALSDSLLSAALKLLQDEMAKRQLVSQGRLEQHTADLENSLKDAKDAAKTDEGVRALDDAGLDAGLERMRQSAAGGG